jgi:hypothetical protein
MSSRDTAIAVLVASCLTGAWGVRLDAQDPGNTAELRDRIGRRFDVLPVRDGVVLRPRSQSEGFRSVEVTGDIIAVDGRPATGAELRDKIGTDADLILRLSYLTPEDRRRLFDGTPSPALAPPPSSDEPPFPRRPRRERRTRGEDARLRIGGSITVDADEVVDGDVVVIGGSAQVLGEVRGNVVVVGGSLDLGPRANVEEDVTVVAGSLARAPTARIGGSVNEVRVGGLNWNGWRWGDVRLQAPSWMWLFGPTVSLMVTLSRVAVLALLCFLVVLLGRESVERIGARAAAEPIKAGAVGLLTQLLFVPILVLAIVILVITIIGIPLLVLIPFAILGLAIVALVGFTAVACRVGRLLASRLGQSGDNPYFSTLLGLLLLLSPLLLGRLVGLAGPVMLPMSLLFAVAGALVEYLAWTVGFGAVALMRFSRPLQASPAA